jgi:hypothetical protein
MSSDIYFPPIQMSAQTFNLVRGIVVRRDNFFRALHAAGKLHQYFVFGLTGDQAIEIKPNISKDKLEKMIKSDLTLENGDRFFLLQNQDRISEQCIFEYPSLIGDEDSRFIVIGDGQYFETLQFQGFSYGNVDDPDKSIVMYKPRSTYSEKAASIIHSIPRDQVIRVGHIFVLAD